jgi:hypothetical protein
MPFAKRMPRPLDAALFRIPNNEKANMPIIRRYLLRQIIVRAIRNFSLVLMMGCIMTATGRTQEAPDITGRWTVSEKPPSNTPTSRFPDEGNRFDFARCGDAWCGVEVDKDGKCGRTAFRLLTYSHSIYRFKGQLATLDIAQPYTLFFGVGVADRKDILWADGELSSSSERAYPGHFEMSRQGDAACKAEVLTPTGVAWEAPDITGRWIVSSLEEGHVPEEGSLFDVTRCGEVWCGVEVDKDGKCGRTAFHFFPAKDLEPEHQFRGQFSASDQIRTEDLFVDVYGNSILAETTVGRLPTGRIYGLSVKLSRQGDAVCKAEYKPF